MRKQVRVGISLGTDSLTAVELRRTWRGVRPEGGRTWSWPLAKPFDDAGQATLAAALEELRAMLDAASASASIALLRPLAQAKVITTPPIGRHALELLVQRNAQRYFIAGAELALVAAAPVSARTGKAESSRAVAAYAAEPTVAAITAAAAEAGFVVERITAAPLALDEAIRTLVPPVRRGRVLALVRGAGWVEALLLDNDRLRLALALPPAAVADADSLARTIARLVSDGADCGCRPQHAIVLTDDAAMAAAAFDMLTGTESEVAPLPLPEALAQISPAALVAFGAALAGARTPLLFTDGLRQTRRRRSVRRTVSLYAAAAMMLAVGAVAQLWSVQRELNQVEARRRSISASLGPAMAARRSVEAARTTLETLARLERETPRWTRVLSALAHALPDSAYLLSLNTNGAKVQLTGVATSAHAIVAPLEASPAFAEVALTGTARRDAQDGRERFELSATIGTVPTTPATLLPAGRSEP